MKVKFNQLKLAKFKPVLIGVVAIGGALGLGFVGTQMTSQWQAQQRDQQRLQQLEATVETGDYAGCLKQAEGIGPQSLFYSQTQAILAGCQLAQAQTFAATEQWSDAITLLIELPAQAPEAEAAQTLIHEWSQALLSEAELQFQTGNLDGALEVLATIPENSPSKIVATKIEEQWTHEWQANQLAVTAAQELLDEGQWLDAKNTLQGVTDNGYWQTTIEPLLDEADTGIEAVLRYERHQAEVVGYDQEIAARQQAQDYFNQRLHSLYDTFVTEGMAEWEAWILACETMGGQSIDQGPESVCQPI